VKVIPLKKNLKITISVIIVVFLLVFVYFFDIFKTPDKKLEYEEESEINEIDNRISPLENQGLILEVNRIRHRGLLDKIMKFGFSWRNKPKFFVVTNIDGGKYSSNEESGFIYNSWDTIGQEFRNIRDIQEEQTTSEITISVFEQVRKGLLRKNEIEKERLQLTYDYKTGRWTGDDFFDDSDGYGHHLGKNFEIWFNIYQTDFDQDGIPYWTEVNVLDTDPQVDDSKLDPDEDGIPTTWEWKWNYDPHVWDDHTNLDPDIDGIENIEEYQMEKWFANPFCQDIYIEVDGMKKARLFDRNHILYEESMQILIERFCEHKINVYIDNGWPGGPINAGGELLPHINDAISWNSGMSLQYYKHHFPDERKKIFRYVLICHDARPAAFCGNTEFNRFDTIVADSNLKSIIVWRAFTPRTQRVILASVLLHELGHTLGIGPNTIAGCDNASFLKGLKKYLEEWGNYKSVMNYYYIYSKRLVDYSDGTNGYNDQKDWEKIYLPFFQIEEDVVVDPFYAPITKKGINENVSIELDGWEYSEKYTNYFIEDISGWSPIDPIECDWSVYLKTEDVESSSNRNIRIYVKPKVPFSVWSLFKEETLVAEG